MANQSDALLSNLRRDLLEGVPDLELIPDDPAHCIDAQAAAVASLIRDLTKKEVPAINDKGTLLALRDAAVEKFLWANERCRLAPTRSFQSGLTEAVVHEVQALLSRLPDVSFQAIFERGRVASGASLGSQGHNSELEKLFLNEITTYSVEALQNYLSLVGTYPTYALAEKQRQVSLVGSGKPAFRVVDESSFSTVRKTRKTDRGICTEASLDMFFQLGLGELINEFLRSEFGYCEKRQPDRNRALVLKGSRDGSTASIDSTSASDLWSVFIVCMLFKYRRDWYEMLMLLRADQTKLPDKTSVCLHMISSMGNGYTFPLETLLFSAVVRGVANARGVAFERYDKAGTVPTRYGVFGDDIICPAEIAEDVMSVLTDLGHVPNLTKSYVTGPYRESCGVDAFQGCDVRAVFHKHWSRQGRYATINALNFWSARWGIPLRRTVRYLLPKGWKTHFIPMHDDPSTGIYPPAETPVQAYTSWAKSNTIEEIYFVRVQKEADGKVRYHMLRERFKRNPFGVLLCHVAGSLRNGVITRRDPPDVCDDHLRGDVLNDRPLSWLCYQELRLAGVSKDMWTALASVNLAI